jgi:bifunctional DNA-binding transcriptional regulator/antitoxin component of YhaV-PrlF toxin-antitoxin module
LRSSTRLFGVKTKTFAVGTRGCFTVPIELRRKHGIKAGTQVRFVEGEFGHIILHPITKENIDRLAGSLADNGELLKTFQKDRRREARRRPKF